jgi:hypothetical protein
VGDEHRGASLSGEGAKAAEHLVRLRRRQHRRGLVEQQNRGVGGQRPEDLESLPGADGQTARPHIGIERKAHAGRQVPYAVTELAWPGDAPACRERDVLRHGQSWYRGEVLVYDADSRAAGVAGRAQRCRAPAHRNRTRVGTQQPAGDVHQG